MTVSEITYRIAVLKNKPAPSCIEACATHVISELLTELDGTDESDESDGIDGSRLSTMNAYMYSFLERVTLSRAVKTW